jgi:hypothetical protein
MIGQIKNAELIVLKINFRSMIGKINVPITVGKEAIVVILTIQMIKINTIDKIKDMINPTLNKSRIPNLTKTNKF